MGFSFWICSRRWTTICLVVISSAVWGSRISIFSTGLGFPTLITLMSICHLVSLFFLQLRMSQTRLKSLTECFEETLVYRNMIRTIWHLFVTHQATINIIKVKYSWGVGIITSCTSWLRWCFVRRILLSYYRFNWFWPILISLKMLTVRELCLPLSNWFHLSVLTKPNIK